MEEIKKNLDIIHQRIKNACELSGRNTNDVKLLLATKTVSPEIIKFALNNGESLIAENKVQELKDKFADLQDVEHTTHFIGHLQTNKIKDVLKYASCIQSVDRLDLVEKLDQRLQFENKSIDILIQVNTSNEESKFGIEPDKALDLVKQASSYKTLNIKGLMTIGLFSADEKKVRECFKLLKNIQQQIIQLNLPNVEMNVLSMGMSNDLEIAISEGSTMVRVGTAIFGKRQYSDSHYWNENKN